MSWVFCPVFSFSILNWKLKTISIRNYNQHFTFKKDWEEFYRSFISYIWKSFELVVINRLRYCHEINISCTVIRIFHKDGSEYLLLAISFDRLLLAVCLTNPVEQHKVHEIKRFAHQRSVSCYLIAIAKNAFQSNCFDSFLAKNRLVTIGKRFHIQLPEAVTQSCFVKEVFLKISQYSKEIAYVGVLKPSF